jgi:16S rRNA (uracil1498-N3)-methyltransferase
VLSLGARSLELALGARRAVAAAPVAITLWQAVPRGERMDLIVQKATELGVTAIVPVLAGRSVARPPATRAHRWQTIAQEAARQSGRADVPAVAAPRSLAEALAEPAPAGEARFVLWEAERARPLRRALEGCPAHVALLVGPEGGFSRHEVDLAHARGFLAVGLGPRILRVETAAIVAVALVQAAAGGLD